MHNFAFYSSVVISTVYLDSVYTVPDSRGHGIEFGQFVILLTLANFSLISCC